MTVIIRSKVQVSLQLSQLVSLLKLGFKFHNKIQIKLHDKISKCEGFDNIILKFPSLTLLEPKKQILPLLCLFVYNIIINPKSTGGGGGGACGFWLITSEVAESFSTRNFATFPDIKCRIRTR